MNQSRIKQTYSLRQLILLLFFWTLWPNRKESATSSHTLSFTLKFPYADDTVYLSYCYPYTYSFLQDYLSHIQVYILHFYINDLYVNISWLV